MQFAGFTVNGGRPVRGQRKISKEKLSRIQCRIFHVNIDRGTVLKTKIAAVNIFRLLNFKMLLFSLEPTV